MCWVYWREGAAVTTGRRKGEKGAVAPWRKGEKQGTVACRGLVASVCQMAGLSVAHSVMDGAMLWSESTPVCSAATATPLPVQTDVLA